MPRYTGPESIQQVQSISIRLDDGGKLEFEPENGRFRVLIVSPRGAILPVALFTAERLRNIGAALIALASGEWLSEPPPDVSTDAEGARFSLLEID